MITDRSPHLSCVWSDPLVWDTLNPLVDVPDEPGYYAFTDYPDRLQPSAGNKQVLYVGIATNSLRDRLKVYKSGDTSGLKHMHRGGLHTLLSRAGAAHASIDASNKLTLTHSVQRTPITVTMKATATHPAQQSVLAPPPLYVRWAVDYRAAIEAKLIQQLGPRFNTMHN